MTIINLQFDNKATKSLNDLMTHYKVQSRAELITKAIAALKIAAMVDQTNGELIARRGKRETKIKIR